MIWIMFTPCADIYGFKHIKAEPPCRKGEISLTFLHLTVTLGWGYDSDWFRLFRRFIRVEQIFGVYWDKKKIMRCLNCKGKLSIRISPNSFSCENCGSKHTLRLLNGVLITQGRALSLIDS